VAPALAAEIDSVDGVDAAGFDVVVIGEIHDNPEHHVGQATLIERIRPSAVVFEMLNPGQAETAELIGPDASRDALAEALDWSVSGWPDFSLYHEVFEAAEGAEIFGAALPRDTVRSAFEVGAAEAFGEAAARFGLDAPLPEGQQASREEGQMAAHCDALPEEMLPGMVSAQRLRDAHFARVTLDALAETGGPVVLITGNGHARTDWGVPAALARAAPEIEVLSIGQLEAPPDGDPPYDLWRVTAPAERGDPCEAFR
jgi:uncharacterized iron-regulated protein